MSWTTGGAPRAARHEEAMNSWNVQLQAKDGSLPRDDRPYYELIHYHDRNESLTQNSRG